MGQIILFLILLTLGYGFGQLAERRHYKSIIAREKQFNTLPAIATRFPPDSTRAEGYVYQQQLVLGSVVIASDYFKAFLAGLVNFFGGSVVSYESLLDRARREALLRMKKNASELGADMVFNVKYETSTVGGSRTSSIEVLVYGTALLRQEQDQNSPPSEAGKTIAEIINGRVTCHPVQG